MEIIIQVIIEYLNYIEILSGWEQFKTIALLFLIIIVLRYIINWFVGTTRLSDIKDELKEIKEIIKRQNNNE